jgi:hypothetical protein
MFVIDSAEPNIPLIEIGLVSRCTGFAISLRAELDTGVRRVSALDFEFESQFEIGNLSVPEQEFVPSQRASGRYLAGDRALFDSPQSLRAAPPIERLSVKEDLSIGNLVGSRGH